LARMTNRDTRTIRKWEHDKELPPRIQLTDRTKGWLRETVVAWLKAHPEAFNNG